MKTRPWSISDLPEGYITHSCIAYRTESKDSSIVFPIVTELKKIYTPSGGISFDAGLDKDDTWCIVVKILKSNIAVNLHVLVDIGGTINHLLTRDILQHDEI